MLTVKQSLQLPALAGATVIAGTQGLDRPIASVTAVDVPDFTPWLRGNEFLLMTGYAFRDKEEGLAELIAHLGRAGVSAVGIKFKRYLDRLPESAQEIADQVGLPVIAIPYECAWIDVINPVMGEIINQQAQQLMRSDEIRRRLIEQVFSHGGLTGIGRLLAGFVENPVSIIDLGANAAVHSDGDGKWPVPPKMASLTEYYLPAAGEEVQHVQSLPLVMHFTGGGHPRIVVPIDAAQATTGYIVIYEMNRPLRPTDMVPLEQSTMVAALEIERLEAGRKATRYQQHDFLRRVLAGELASHASARLLAGEVGWSFGEHYEVAVMEPVVPGDSRQLTHPESPRRTPWDVKVYLLRNASRVLSPDVVFGLDAAQRLVALCPLDPGQVGKAASTHSGGKAERLLAAFSAAIAEIDPGYVLNIGIGRFYPGYQGVQLGYSEAVEALTMGSQIHREGTVTYYADLGVYRLFKRSVLGSELESFFEETVGPLLEMDQHYGAELLKTLRAFLETGGNHRLTARQLYLHHNTVRYRIKSIEQLCHVNLKNESDRLNLAIGLRLIPLVRPEWIAAAGFH